MNPPAYFLTFDATLSTEDYQPFLSYCTGLGGDAFASVGQSELDSHVSVWFRDHACYSGDPDMQHQRSPFTLTITPGWFNDGLGREYPNEDWGSDKVLLNYRGLAPGEDPSVLKPGTGPGRFPAYLGHTILLDGTPPTTVMVAASDRAKEYAQRPLYKAHQPFRILGVRLMPAGSRYKP